MEDERWMMEERWKMEVLRPIKSSVFVIILALNTEEQPHTNIAFQFSIPMKIIGFYSTNSQYDNNPVFEESKSLP